MKFIDILEKEENPQKIYYWACILGGEDSFNPLIHKVVEILLKNYDFDIYLYSPSGRGIPKVKLNTKEKKIIKELNKKFNTNKNNKINYINRNILYDNSLSIRGFTDIQLIYQGNAKTFGRIPDYIINNNDIKILRKLINTYDKEELIKVLQIYFQLYQQFHANKLFWYNHQGLFNKNGIEIDYKNNDYTYSREKANYISNIITSLFYMGDCRENSFIYSLIKEIENLDNFTKLINKSNYNEVEKIIKNNYRIFNINIYYNSHFEKSKDYGKYLPTFKEIKNTDNLNSFEKKMLKYDKYIYVENHNNNGIILDNNKIHFYDLMYNDNYKKLNNEYTAEYVFDNRILNVNDLMIETKSCGIKPNIKIIVEIIEPFYDVIKNKQEITNLVYLGKKIEIPKIFYNINKYVIEREKEFYEIRKSIFNKNIKVNRFDVKKESKFTEYLLLEDL